MKPKKSTKAKPAAKKPVTGKAAKRKTPLEGYADVIPDIRKRKTPLEGYADVIPDIKKRKTPLEGYADVIPDIK